MAGLTLLQLLPTTYFGSRQALEGKEKSRIRGRQVGSQLHPSLGPGVNPKPAGRTHRCPGNSRVSPWARGASVTLQGHQRSSGHPQPCTGYPPTLHPSTTQPLPQVDFIWKKKEIHLKYSF